MLGRHPTERGPMTIRAGTVLIMAFALVTCGPDRQSDSKLAEEKATTAPQWVLQRSTMAGACHVKAEPALPNLGAVITTRPDRKRICEEALRRNGDDAADTQTCLEYTAGAKKECRAEGIALP